jgi:hypothetical protein
MIKDVDMRFIVKQAEHAGDVYIHTRATRVLQWRKLVKTGPINCWTWEWTEWTDVPLAEVPATVTGKLHR